MENNEKEVKMILGNNPAPADMLVFDDPTYGKRVFVRQGGNQYKEETKPPKEPVWIHNKREFEMDDARAFVGAVTRYGKPAEGVVFYSAEKITMFFNAMNREESITLPLKLSLELTAFLGEGPGIIRSQKSFLKALETYPECVKDVTMIRAMAERLQMSKEITFESNLDPDNISFVYTEKGGKQEGKMPKKLTLNLPYFEGSESRIEIEVALSVEMPTKPDEKPAFKLENVKHERTEKDALALEVQGLQQKLPEWLFLHGEF